MKTYQISIVVGSLRQGSWNQRLAKALARMLPKEFRSEMVEIGDLPLYNQDDDNNPAEQVSRLREQIKDSDGVIFVTPEYNRSIPGVLKNALDHASRPGGQSVWRGKAAGVIGVAGGAIGTATAQQHLRNILAALNMPTMGHPEVFLHYRDGLFAEDGAIGPGNLDFVQGWVDSYAQWVRLHNLQKQSA